MLTNILARASFWLPSQQQVRFVRKTIKYKYAYGIEPIVSEDGYQQIVETEQIKDLKFEPVRFAHVTDTSSPLYDNDLNKFTRYVMQGGKRKLADELMHDTFLKIKSIQFTRKRKQEAKMAAKEAKGENTGSATKTVADINSDDAENEEIEMNPLVIFKKALKNSEPIVITRKVKRGGATYQVPFPIDAKQSEYFATKWLISAVLDRPKPRTKHFGEVMAQELIDAAGNKGKVIKRKDDMHKLADANKAYAHYRWG